MPKPSHSPSSRGAPSLVPAQVDEYEIVRPLGRGAMGQVFEARDTLLGRPVAVKFLASISPDETARERFLIEARAIARLHHPNVLSIYRVGWAEGRPYLASEFVRGQSLDKLELPLPWQKVLDIALQLARGLGAAHRQGVLHRDLKPASGVAGWCRRGSGAAAALRTALGRALGAAGRFVRACRHERADLLPL